MIRTLNEALSFVRRHGAVPMTPAGDLPSFVTEVAGEAVKGSWWGHPKGQLIYDLAEALLDSSEACSVPLIDGKATLLHRSLLPALYRIVSDPAWRRSKTRKLSAIERKLLAAVGRAGSLEPDSWARRARIDPKALKKARERLAKDLLVKSSSVHTSSGKHVSVLEDWGSWAKKEVQEAARNLSLEASQKELSDRCRRRAPAL